MMEHNQITLSRSRSNGLATTMVIFFLCGYVTVLNSILIPYLQDTLNLSYTYVNFIPLSFYLAYFIASPIVGEYFKNKSYLVGVRSGILMGILASLCLIAMDSATPQFAFILITIFLLGVSIATIQVSGNPYILQLAGKEKGASWMTLVHAATSFGMILAPIIGSSIILSSLSSDSIVRPLFWIYATLALAWIGCLLATSLLSLHDEKPCSSSNPTPYWDVLKDKGVLAGMLAIACSVGIEVSCSSFIIEFLASKEILSTTLLMAGMLSTLFWIIFTVGRAIAGIALRKMSEQHLLYLLCMLGVLFCIAAITTTGVIAAVSLLSLGFSTSALYPIIFSITINRTHHNPSTVSGLLCMANIGGALFPIIQGLIADQQGVQFSYIIPLIGYLLIVFYLYFISNKQLEMGHRQV